MLLTSTQFFNLYYPTKTDCLSIFAMPSVTTASFYVLLIFAIAIQFFLSSPSTTMTSHSRLWADSPCKLITTPQYATNKVFDS